jgi:nitroreductase
MSRDPYALRYGTPEPPSAGLLRNPVLDQILGHRSVRTFLPDSLAPEILPTLVAAAQSAATFANIQWWSVLAVEDPERKRKLAELSGNQAHIQAAPLFLVFLVDHARLRAVAGRHGADPAYLSGFDGWTTAVTEAYLGAQNAVLAAESLGLGTVYIGTLRRDPVAVARVLNLPPEVFAVIGISIGKPDPSRPTRIKPRLSQSVVFHQETYHPTDFSEIERYDRRLAELDGGPDAPESLWSRRTANRLSRTGSLAQAARQLGFKFE